ncbi:MAG: CDP-alcohol phosphatidyltransferase family protein [Actinomycetota bacterium]
MLTKLLRLPVRKVVAPVGRAISAVGLTANHMTVLGFLTVSVAAGFLARGSLMTAGWVLLAGAAFDILDGAVARASNSMTTAGAFLDSTLDRLSDGIIFSALAWYVAPDGFELALALTCLVLGFTTSYIRAKAEGVGLTCNVGIAERSERIIVLIIGLLFGILIQSLMFLTALSAITVIHRFVHVWKQAKNVG